MELGGYHVVRRLRAGGMGEVFLARRDVAGGMGRPVVIKTVHERFAGDREHESRFLDEVRVAIQLRHRNICSVTDVGKNDGALFLVMEYVAGRDLRDALDALSDRGVKVSPTVGLFVMKETLEALDYAHRFADPRTGAPLSIVHRDVSPSNVLLSLEGEVQLIDFGHASSTMKLEKTQAGVVIGKSGYMSPEQARGDVVGAPSDVFSAGIIAAELLSGEPYYEGRSNADMRRACVDGFRSPTLDLLEAPERALVERMLAHDPRARITAGEAAREAGRLIAKSGEVAGAGELRSLMRFLFPDEVRRQRELFTEALGDGDEARESHVYFSRLDELGAADANAPPRELTQRVRVRLTEQPTARVPVTSRRRAALGAIAAVVALAGVATIVVVASTNVPAPTPPIAVAPPVVPATPATPATPTTIVAPVTPTTIVTPDEPIEPIVADDDTHTVKHHAGLAKKRAPVTIKEKLDFLGKCNQDCAPVVIDKYRRFGSLSVDEARGVAGELDGCVKRCTH